MTSILDAGCYEAKRNSGSFGVMTANNISHFDGIWKLYLHLITCHLKLNWLIWVQINQFNLEIMLLEIMLLECAALSGSGMFLPTGIANLFLSLYSIWWLEDSRRNLECSTFQSSVWVLCHLNSLELGYYSMATWQTRKDSKCSEQELHHYRTLPSIRCPATDHEFWGTSEKLRSGDNSPAILLGTKFTNIS